MSTTEVEALEVLDTSVPNYDEEIGGIIYEQVPLSFFGKIELFSVLANAIEKALADGAIISELLGDLPNASAMSAGDLSDSDVFVRAIAKVMKYAPETLQEIFAISLKIKRNERALFFSNLEDISDEQAMRILNHFLDQNWDAIMDFFKEQVKPLIANVSEKLQPSESTSSKPSKVTRRRTAKE
jgi:hypothetical protein